MMTAAGEKLNSNGTLLGLALQPVMQATPRLPSLGVRKAEPSPSGSLLWHASSHPFPGGLIQGMKRSALSQSYALSSHPAAALFWFGAKPNP